MRSLFLFFLLMPALVLAHGGALDNQGGHFSRQDNTYHCHKEPCFTIHEQADEAYRCQSTTIIYHLSTSKSFQ